MCTLLVESHEFIERTLHILEMQTLSHKNTRLMIIHRQYTYFETEPGTIVQLMIVTEGQ